MPPPPLSTHHTQAIVAGKESPDNLAHVLAMLRQTTNPQVEYIIRVMRKWAAEQGLP